MSAQTLLVRDYAALEVVVMADLTKRLFGDTLLETLTAPGTDIHARNARTVFGEYLGWKCPDGRSVLSIPVPTFAEHPYGHKLRRMVKTVFYGLQYGKGAYGFSTLPGPDGNPIGEDAAQEMLDGFRKALPGLFAWQGWCRQFVDNYRGIYSLGGRWCDLEAETDANAPDWLRRRAYRRAYNFPLQATAAEIIGDAMVRLAADPAWGATDFRVMLQVHDELVARGPMERVEEADALLKLHMEAATANGNPLVVPLRTSGGHAFDYHSAK